MSARAPLPGVLQRQAVEDARAALSRGGMFSFSARQLFYELVRRKHWPPPAGSPRDALVSFRRALGAYQAENGRVVGLLSARAARASAPAEEAPDLLDYSVRRVLVVDRVETFLVLVMNGFHREVEVGLLALDRDGTLFPASVARRVEGQLRAGQRTAFYTLHDANARGMKLRARVHRLLARHGNPRVVDAGLTFAQTFRIGVPVRLGAKRCDPPTELDEEERLLLARGNYAHLEELTPLSLLRWAYERIVRGPDDLGFG